MYVNVRLSFTVDSTVECPALKFMWHREPNDQGDPLEN